MQNVCLKSKETLYLLMMLPMFESFITDVSEKLIKNGFIVYYTIYALLLLLNMSYILKSFYSQKNMGKGILLVGLFCAFLYSYNKNNASFTFIQDTTNFYRLFFYHYLYFVAAQAVEDYQELFGWFVKSAKISIVLGFYTLIRLLIWFDNSDITHSLTWGYFIAFCTVLIIYEETDSIQTKLLNSFFIASGIYMCLLGGGRGAFVVLLLAILIKMFFFGSKNKSIMRILSFITLFVIFISGLSTKAIYWIVKFFGMLNLESRTLNTIINSTLVTDTARERLYSAAKDALSFVPLFGYGIASDRHFANGYYIHNFVYEILLQYGYPVGILILSLLSYNLIKGLLNANKKRILISFAVVFVPMLMLSSSYLLTVFFWIMIGIATKKDKRVVSYVNRSRDIYLKLNKQQLI